MTNRPASVHGFILAALLAFFSSSVFALDDWRYYSSIAPASYYGTELQACQAVTSSGGLTGESVSGGFCYSSPGDCGPGVGCKLSSIYRVWLTGDQCLYYDSAGQCTDVPPPPSCADRAGETVMGVFGSGASPGSVNLGGCVATAVGVTVTVGGTFYGNYSITGADATDEPVANSSTSPSDIIPETSPIPDSNQSSTTAPNVTVNPDGSSTSETTTTSSSTTGAGGSVVVTADTVLVEYSDGDKKDTITQTTTTTHSDGSVTIEVVNNWQKETPSTQTYEWNYGGGNLTGGTSSTTAPGITTGSNSTTTDIGTDGSVTSSSEGSGPDSPESDSNYGTYDGAGQDGLLDAIQAHADSISNVQAEAAASGLSLPTDLISFTVGTGTCAAIPYDLGRFGVGSFDSHCAFYDAFLHPALKWLFYMLTAFYCFNLFRESIQKGAYS